MGGWEQSLNTLWFEKRGNSISHFCRRIQKKDDSSLFGQINYGDNFVITHTRLVSHKKIFGIKSTKKAII